MTNSGSGATSLHITAALGLIHLSRALLCTPLFEGTNEVNARNTHGETPLLLAAAGGHLDIVRMLLQRGEVDVNAKTYGATWSNPLLSAIRGGHVDVVQALLSHDDIDIRVSDHSDNGAVHWAAMSGNRFLVKLLIEEHGVEADRTNHSELTPLWYAVEHGDQETVGYLLSRDDVRGDRCDPASQRTMLHQFMTNTPVGVVEQLVKRRDVDVNARDKIGRTPLHEAVWCGRMDVVKALASSGRLDLEVRDNMGFTALSWAVWRWNSEVGPAFLIDSLGCDIRTKDDLGFPLVSLAALYEQDESLVVLIERGQDINEKDPNGNTPLVYWISRKYLSGLEWLLGRNDVDWDVDDKIAVENWSLFEEYRQRRERIIFDLELPLAQH